MNPELYILAASIISAFLGSSITAASYRARIKKIEKTTWNSARIYYEHK